MTARLDPFAAAPSLMKEWQRTSIALTANFDPDLAELVKIRASQINGCANCLNLHTHFARENGESLQRLNLLAAWRDAPCYTDRERAALEWTEALTRLSEQHTHVNAYEGLKAHFTEQERVALTLAIVVINGWNRVVVGFGGWADPAAVKAQAAAVA
ncbi:MAG TPA: carboxymuconolactone decarboxylase family protein [Steroidobacteraceae bacterium]|nr:carboxymuconolactone decarboxylase family protein [Steroidobacteraceae bacterium]